MPGYGFFLIPSKGDQKYQVEKLELYLKHLKESDLKYNIEKDLFGQTKMEYLGFWSCINPFGHLKIKIKLDAIKNIIPPATQKGVCNCLDLVK